MSMVRAGALVALAVAVVIIVVPPGRTYLKAAVLGADALELGIPHPFSSVERSAATVGGVPVHRYAPNRRRPGIVLVPGAAPRGLEDERVIALATALARSGRDVVVPRLSLYDEQLTRADVQRIRRVISGHAADTGRPVVVVGISYGGSLALIAADGVADGVARVATFGAYGDLVGVIQAVTTGVSVVDGRRIPWDGHPQAEEVLRDRAVELAPRRARVVLRHALAGRIDPRHLPPEVRAVHDLIANDDPEATFELARDLPRTARDRLERLSPVHAVDELDDVVIMHAIRDPLVPFGEALRLHRAIESSQVHVLRTFSHVETPEDAPGGWWDRVRDTFRVWRFAASVLEPHERVLPAVTLRRDVIYGP